jgi:hypothetical protein
MARKNSKLAVWEATAQREQGRIYNLKQPNSTMVGFVPVLPATRSLKYLASEKRLVYTTDYAANYYALRDAIARDQYDRRGGYRKAYDCPLTLYALYIVSCDKEPLHSNFQSNYDLDNCNKTFIDALSTTTYRTAGRRRYRHIEDDSQICRLISERREAHAGEMCGVWYAMKATDFRMSITEEGCELYHLATEERFNHSPRCTFDVENLATAYADGEAFLNRMEEIDANRRTPLSTRMRAWISRILIRLAKLIDPQKDTANDLATAHS